MTTDSSAARTTEVPTPEAGYRNASLEIEDRVDDLMSYMTLEEKLAQLGGVWSTELLTDQGFSDVNAARLLANGTGQITRIAASTGLRPEGIAQLHNQIQNWLLTHTRLGIPAVVHEEAVAGFCARDAVAFPQAIGLGATWNPLLLEQIATQIRSEMLAVGARQALSPVLDIARDPRWGRVEETYGEDPILTAELGVAYVRGLQADANDAVGGATRTHLHQGVIATAKHFLGYGLSDGGLNHGPVQLGERELREVFAEPFAAVIRDAHIASIMNSYASVDGLAPAGSRALLTELLRDELGFAGTVVADYFSVDMLVTHHKVAATKGVAAAKALLAGLDQELPTLDCYAQLTGLLSAGIVPEAVLDLSLRRVLRQKFALGLFEAPLVDESAASSAFGTPAGRSLARCAAQQSLVLLKNDGILPLDSKKITSIAVIGPAGDNPRLFEGDYHYPAHLELLFDASQQPHESALAPHSSVSATGEFSPGPYLPQITTALAGLQTALAGMDVAVHFAQGCEVTGTDRSGFEAAVTLAAACDIAVVCVGGRSGLTLDATVGEARDATELELTGLQVELLEAVHNTGTPSIAVVVSGRVHTLASVEAASSATLLAWLPGCEGGGAIADLLLGNVAPSGRLPVSLPRSVGQLPVHYNHRSGGGLSNFWGEYTDSPTTPLHPFGFGLSTTSFSYSEPMFSEGTTTEPTVVQVTVTNTGQIDADEVVQCYVRDDVASVARPVRQLVGFARLRIAAGEAQTLRFVIHPSRLAFYDEQMDFVCEPGAFRIELGGCAGHPKVVSTCDLSGDVAHYRQSQVVATAIELIESP
ncbi:MAG: glycoside hydrolase family 3 N-terminal domain-containing protein [Microthrixaceae bacterium]